MDENKPLGADSEEESFESDLFPEGENDVDSGAQAFTLEELNELVGRTGDNAFTSKEDFAKHYGNLKSFVGKRQEPEKREEPKRQELKGDDLRSEIAQIKAMIAEKDFLSDNPEAKGYVEIVRSVSKDKGVSLSEAWNTHVKELAEAHSAVKKEREVGVKSINRISPQANKELQHLEKVARESGDASAQEALVAKALGLK